MRIAKDYTGQRFGDWLVLYRDDTDKRKKKWICKCSCGTINSVNIDNLKRGASTRCQRCKGKLSSKRMITHGESKTRLYYVWLAMRNRCYRPGVNGYENYGGRGIEVCNEWKQSYEAFRDWSLSHGYKQGLQIDRIDNDGNYSPQNCRWVTHYKNMQNTRKNKKVYFHGKWQTRSEIADTYHISKRLFKDRLAHGWSVEEALYYEPHIGNNQNLRRINNG
jgi:hypothetical protein